MNVSMKHHASAYVHTRRMEGAIVVLTSCDRAESARRRNRNATRTIVPLQAHDFHMQQDIHSHCPLMPADGRI